MGLDAISERQGVRFVDVRHVKSVAKLTVPNQKLMKKAHEFEPFLERYRNGEWRAKIFRDLILSDIHKLDNPPIVLDIGCGQGFDDSVEIQMEIAHRAKTYVGVDPDSSVIPAEFIDEYHCCLFENAAIEASSVDIAFAVMVLEHVRSPKAFWRKLDNVLKPNGIFWGFTVDRRHPFCHASRLMETFKIKDLFLNALRGERGVERYANYPTYYRLNSPRQLNLLVSRQSELAFLNFSRIGQIDYYVPKILQPVAHGVDRAMMAIGLPGHLCAIRWNKLGDSVERERKENWLLENC